MSSAPKHFVATGYVVRDHKTLLLFHKKLQLWLPPGGHIDEGELPEEALRRECWLEERGSIGGLLASIGKAVVRGDIPLGETLKEADLFGAERAREAKEKEDARLSEALHRESIDAEEARWLIGHLERAEDLSVGERKLLAFIKANSPAIDPALDPYFEKAGL